MVGGTVRDVLLGRAITDFDFIVPRGALDIARDFADDSDGSLVILDEARGIARVVLRDRTVFDFADYQRDTLDGDLRARDFTINAIAIEVHDGQLSCAPGALEDVAGERLRCTDNAVLDEDPLRLLRAVRFYCTLRFELSAELQAAIRERASLLESAAAERRRDELFKILQSDRAAAGARLLADLRLAPAHWDPSHLDVIEERVESAARPPIDVALRTHLGARLAGERTRHGLLRWCALRHRATADEVVSELALSRVEERMARANQHAAAQLGAARMLRPHDFRHFFRDAAGAGVEMLLLASSSASLRDRALAWYFSSEERDWARPLLSGHDIERICGLAPGPHIGQLLEALADAQVDGLVRDLEAAEDFVRTLGC
jgi:tRNA nucleotidyltransferase (CCA-adding enzyme)